MPTVVTSSVDNISPSGRGRVNTKQKFKTMEQKEIIEGNKQILLFMGGVVGSSTIYPTGEVVIHSIHLGDKQINDFINEIKYHSSWDWLMPVWDKLGKEMYKIRRQISGEEYKKAEVLTIHILTAFREVDIKSAFLWIAEAIKWYNHHPPLKKGGNIRGYLKFASLLHFV